MVLTQLMRHANFFGCIGLQTMKEVICAWKRMEEERADLEGWMAGTEEELKKMERSPTEEVKELTGQVNRIGVSPIHQ